MPTPLPGRLGVQLYSLREAAAADLPGTLERLGRLGVAGVELAGLHGHDPAAVRRWLDGAGLVPASAHVASLDPDALAAALDELAALGVSTAVAAFLPPADFSGSAAVDAAADRVSAAAVAARDRGMDFGYHNHWWEFAPLPDGSSAWERFFARVDPMVFAELDCYWALVGGADPRAVAERAGERIRLVHVKDGPADDPAAPMVAVGRGAMDYRPILRAASAAEWHLVELDRCATDMFDAIADSVRWLIDQGLSSGR